MHKYYAAHVSGNLCDQILEISGPRILGTAESVRHKLNVNPTSRNRIKLQIRKDEFVQRKSKHRSKSNTSLSGRLRYETLSKV